MFHAAADGEERLVQMLGPAALVADGGGYGVRWPWRKRWTEAARGMAVWGAAVGRAIGAADARGWGGGARVARGRRRGGSAGQRAAVEPPAREPQLFINVELRT